MMMQNPLAPKPMGGPAPAPMNPTGSMGLQQSMPAPPNNALMQAIGGGLNAFRKSFDPEGYKASQAEAKTAEGDKLKQTLALMQQQRALPEEQRIKWAMDNADTVLKITGVDPRTMQLSPEMFANSALDGNIAALSAQAGIGPVVPEPMTEYQRRQLALAEQQAGRPQGVNFGGGAFGEYDPTAPAGSRLNLLRQPTEAPVKMEQYTDGTGQVWDRNPYTGESRKANVPRARVPGEGGGDGGDKPPSGYYATGNPEQPLAPIKGGPADPMRSGVDVDPKVIALETQQSSKWMPIQTNFQEIKSEYGRIKTMGNRQDAVGDLALTVSLTKMLDPGSVARESEVEMTQSAAGAYQQALAWGPRLLDGKTLLPPSVRKQMVDAAREMFGVYEGAYHGLAQDTQARAMQYGLSPERIMLGYEAPAPAGKTASTPAMQMGIRAYAKQSGLPAEAITEFLANPSTPQEIKEFNDHFGEGQAEAILKAMRSGR
jgi:hypothetical protein